MTAPILAVDLGTTNVKAALVSDDGRVLAVRGERCPTQHGARSVVDPGAVVTAACDAVRAVVGSGAPHPQAVVLSAAMHGVVPLDGDGRALGPLSTWADPLGGERVEELRSSAAGRDLHERTGTPLHTSNWVARVPALAALTDSGVAGAPRLGSAKSLVLGAWCGVDVVDASLASATGLFATAERRWDPEALALAGLTAERLGEPVPTTTVVDTWRPGVAAALGLEREVPVVVGASDGVLAHLGIGGEDPAVASGTLGTSGAVRRAGNAATPVAAAGLFRYVLDDDRCVVGGAVSNVGRALEWAALLLHPGLDGPAAAVELVALAGTVPSDAAGVPRFMPRLAAERFPVYDLDDLPRGALEGLGYETDRARLARGIVDGIVASVAAIARALDAAVGPAKVLRIGGGLTASDVVVAALADRVRGDVAVARSTETTAIGAARLARRALDLADRFDFVAR